MSYSKKIICESLERLGRKNIDVITLEECNSTNDECSKIVGYHNRVIVVTEKQSKGRGRLERKWVSQIGKTLCESVGIIFEKTPRDIASITVRAGLEICDALSKQYATNFFIKWPNDIYTQNGEKVAGMLAELATSSDGKFLLTFGVGINIDTPCPPPVNCKVSSLKEATGISIDANMLCSIIANAIFRAADNIDEDLDLSRYAKYDWLLGKRVNAVCGLNVFEGISCGLSPKGELIVRRDSGIFEHVLSGEANTAKVAK